MEGSGLGSECSNALDICPEDLRENIGDRHCPGREFYLGPREQDARISATILHLTNARNMEHMKPPQRAFIQGCTRRQDFVRWRLIFSVQLLQQPPPPPPPSSQKNVYQCTRTEQWGPDITPELWALRTVLAVCRLSGAYNLEVASRFLENFWTSTLMKLCSIPHSWYGVLYVRYVTKLSTAKGLYSIGTWSVVNSRYVVLS